MTKPKKDHTAIKHKAMHELMEFVWLTVYLAFFFCALATYSALLLHEYHVQYFMYSVALINALVIAKVIMIGEYAHLGRRYEKYSIVVAALIKAFLFSLLVLAFHFLEEAIKRIVHGEPFGTAFRDMHSSELMGRAVLVFCTFVPLFAFRGIRSALGEEAFYKLVLRSPEPAESSAAD
jgi:hypothetical protein